MIRLKVMNGFFFIVCYEFILWENDFKFMRVLLFLEENIVEIVENGGGVSIRYKNLGLGVYIIVSLEGGGDKYGFGGWI